MKVESNDSVRIYPYGKDDFLDVTPIEQCGSRVVLYDSFSYYAIVKDRLVPNGIVICVFPTKEWFDEWVEIEKPDIEILMTGGKEE